MEIVTLIEVIVVIPAPIIAAIMAPAVICSWW